MKLIKIRLLLVGSLFSVGARAELPEYIIIKEPSPSSFCGSITRYFISSKNLQAKVTVDVWTPLGYDSSDAKRYPVVYAHDGQNLFDDSFSFAGVSWAVDDACMQLAYDSNFEMPIVVGINNRGSEGLRPNDYFPEKALDYISAEDKAETFIYQTCNDLFLGDEEAAFVAEELKPLIDSLYNTASDMSSTFTIGSSMGALASMYLLCEYPEIFGGAACLSTHWIGSLNLNSDYTMNDDEVCANAVLQYLSTHLQTDGLHRLYMDQGTKDWDAGYLKYEVIAREIVANKGYTQENGHLYVYDAIGAGHNEWYWQQRVEIPLRFLLSKSAIEAGGIINVETDADDSALRTIIYDIKGHKYHIPALDWLPEGLYIHEGKKFVR